MLTQNMNEKDPLHRLYSTPTKASNHQRWDVFHKMEKKRKNAEKKWGLDEKTRIHARKVSSATLPSIATRKNQKKFPKKTIPYSSNSPKKVAKRKNFSSRRPASYGKKSIPYSSSSPKKVKRKTFSSRRPSSYSKKNRNPGKKEAFNASESKKKNIRVGSRVEVDEIKKLEEELDALLDGGIENSDNYVKEKKNQTNSIVNKKKKTGEIVDKKHEKAIFSSEKEMKERDSKVYREGEKSKQKQVDVTVEETITEVIFSLDEQIEQLGDVVDHESIKEEREEQGKVIQHNDFEQTEKVIHSTTALLSQQGLTDNLLEFPDKESKKGEVTQEKKDSESIILENLMVAQVDMESKEMSSSNLVSDIFFSDSLEYVEEQYDESKEKSCVVLEQKKLYPNTSMDEKGIEKEPIDILEMKEKEEDENVDSSNGSTKKEKQNIVPIKPFTAPKIELKRVKSKALERVSMVSEEDGMKVFDNLDENSFGKLPIEKLDQGVTMLWRKLENKPAIMAAYKATDSSEEGFIKRSDFGYFLSFVYYHNNLWPLFDIVGGGSDRSISRDQFLKVSPKLNIDNPLMVFKNIDIKKLGIILFDELCDYMAKNSPSWAGEPGDEKIHEEFNSDNPESKEMLTAAPKVLADIMPQTIIEVSLKEKEEKTQFSYQFDMHESQKTQIDQLESKTKIALELKPKAGKIKAQLAVSIPNKEEAMKVFDQLDVNGSRKLSLVELDMGAVTLYPGMNNKLATMAAYTSCDCAGEGYVQRHEFGYFLRFIYYHNNLLSLFGAVDGNKNNQISKNDFLQASPKLNIDNPLSVFKNMDKNNEGIILFDNLCDYMAVHFATWEDERDIAKIQTKFTKFRCYNAESQAKSTPPRSRTVMPGNLIYISFPSKEEEIKVFDELDKDSSGKLPLAELEQGVTRLYPGLENKEAIMAASKASDRDQDGMVNSDEFSYFLRYLLYYNNLRPLFNKEGNGDSISKDRFLNASRHMEIDNPMMVFKKLKTEGKKDISFCDTCDYMATRHIM